MQKTLKSHVPQNVTTLRMPDWRALAVAVIIFSFAEIFRDRFF